jgi:hypothetical protein
METSLHYLTSLHIRASQYVIWISELFRFGLDVLYNSTRVRCRMLLYYFLKDLQFRTHQLVFMHEAGCDKRVGSTPV